MSEVSFKEWAAKRFNLKPYGLMGGKPDLQKLMTYETKLYRPLLPCDAETQKEALKCFDLIQKYCNSEDENHRTNLAIQLCDMSLKLSEQFRDELYSQLCKQTVGCPKREHELRLWQLMLVCACVFPPSSQFQVYLTNYCNQKAETEGESELGICAAYCAARIPQVSVLGPRQNAPLPSEVQYTLKCEPHPITVKLPDESEIEAYVDSTTTTQELNALLAESLGLNNPEPFHCFEIMTSETGYSEVAMLNNVRVLDYLAGWTLQQAESPDKVYTVMYKIRILLGPDMEDPECTRMYFLQTMSDVAAGKYFPGEKDAIALAATALKAWGEEVSVEFIQERLAFLICEAILCNGDPEEWAQRVLDAYSRLPELTAEEAMAAYVKYCLDKVPLYPAAFFLCENPRKPEFPPNILVAIHQHAICFQDLETRETVKEFPYTEILTWANSPTQFLLVYGSTQEQEKIYLDTPQGSEMDFLVKYFVSSMVSRMTGQTVKAK